MAKSEPHASRKSGYGAAGWALGAVAFLAATAALGVSAEAATRTEKTFGNWRVLCVEPDNEVKRCTMTQMHVRENRQTRRRALVLRWSVATNKDREQTISFGVPTGISIKEGVRLSLGEAEPVVIGYSFCGPRMCLATSPLDAKMIAAIKASQTASASYVLGSKRLMQVDLDLKNFGEAYDYLVQQIS